MPKTSFNKVRPCVLTIAGSDSSGGAGIQADLRVFTRLGIHGATAITAVTAQNNQRTGLVHPLPAHMLRAQLEAILDQFPIQVVKIGMLANKPLVDALSNALEAHRFSHVILDPILSASSGGSLLSVPALRALKAGLLRHVGILTPNLREAEVLLGQKIASDHDALEAARALCTLGPTFVLLKGGHGNSRQTVQDLWVGQDGTVRHFTHRRLGFEARGTGCTLSAALAAYLAHGRSLPDAVQAAIRFVQRSLLRSWVPPGSRVRLL